MDTKGETDNNAFIVGDFNTSLTSMDKSSKQKIKKETEILNDTLDQLILIDIYRTFHPKRSEYTWNVLQDRSYVKPKITLNKLKRIGIVVLSGFSNHNTIKLESSYRKKNGENIVLLKNQNGSMNKSRKKSENSSRQMKMEIQLSNIYGMQHLTKFNIHS